MYWKRRLKLFRTRDYWVAGLSATMGAGLGVGAMYFCDPNRGRARRKQLAEKTVSILVQGEHLVEKKGKDMLNRAGGLLAEAMSGYEAEHVPDEILLERVRSRIGHVISEPHSISTTVRGGTVTVGGIMARAEKKRLLKEIRGVPGVHKVEDLLVHEGQPNGRSVPRLLGSLAGAVMLIAMAGGRAHSTRRAA
jgi:hypothetical protein